jgi:hypothetical protein
MKQILKASKVIERKEEGSYVTTKSHILDVPDQLYSLIQDIGDSTNFEEVVFEDNSGCLHADVNELIEFITERNVESLEDENEEYYLFQRLNELDVYKGYWIHQEWIEEEADKKNLSTDGVQR